MRNRTFFFADFQGQRQDIARTVISTVPTMLQRQGIFTEPIGGRLPVIYDPATTTAPNGVSTRYPFPAMRFLQSGSIRWRGRCSTATLCRRAPGRPATSGALPTKRSTRISSTCAWTTASPRNATRYLAASRVSTSGSCRWRRCRTAVERPPERWVLSARTPGRSRRAIDGRFSGSLLNELRIGDTRRGRDTPRRAALRVEPAADLGLPGIPTDGEVPGHVAGVSDQRVPAARLTCEYVDRLRDERDRDREHADVGLRETHGESRRRSAMVSPQRSPTSIADGIVSVHQPFYRPAGCGEYRHTARELPAGQVQTFSIDLQQDADSEPGARRGILRPGRLAARRSPDPQRRRPLHPQFPVGRRTRSVGGFQPRDAESSNTSAGMETRGRLASFRS